MTISSHRHRPSYTLRCFSKKAHIPRVFVVSFRIVLLSIISGLIFMSQATAQNAVNREQAIKIAKGQNGGDGKVLGVTTTTDSAGNTQFAVKIISNGRVRVFTIKKAP